MRYIISLMALLLSLQLQAADGDKSYVVGFAQDTMSNDWRAAQVNEMKAALAPYPFIKFIYTDAKGSGYRQAFDLQKLDKQGADILVTSPRDQKAMTPVISALAKNKPVVLLTRKPLNDSYTAFAGADDHAIAAKAAKLIAERLGGKGRVVMLKGVPTATTAIAREKGFTDALKAYPGIEVVASPVANYRRDDALQKMDELLKLNVGFDAIYAHSDSMAVGARIAMEQAGIKPSDFVIVGIDYIPEAREAILAGKQTASFTYPTAGREGAEVVLKLIRGEKVAKYTDVPFVMVTSENVDKVETIFK